MSPRPAVPFKIQKVVRRFAKRYPNVEFSLYDCHTVRTLVGWSLVMFFDRLRR